MVEENNLPIGVKIFGWFLLIITSVSFVFGTIATLLYSSNGLDYIKESILYLALILFFLINSIFLLRRSNISRYVFALLFLVGVVQGVYELFNLNSMTYAWDLTLIVRFPLCIWGLYYLLFSRRVREAFKNIS
jgi:hypothetical protein